MLIFGRSKNRLTEPCTVVIRSYNIHLQEMWIVDTARGGKSRLLSCGQTTLMIQLVNIQYLLFIFHLNVSF